MAECKACGEWFGTATPQDLCPTCERALKRLGGSVEPVRHGRWVKQYRSGIPVDKGYVSSCCDMWSDRKSNYCPNCGAKMDADG